MVLAIWLAGLLLLSLAPLKGPKTDLPLDKAEHVIAYGVTAILFFRYFRGRLPKGRIYIASVVSASVYGAVMEVLQALTPSRQFSFGDMAANAIGAAVFALVYSALMRK